MSESHLSQTAQTSVLFETIASQIEYDGPISLANYIGLALGDANHGYYHKQDPFGADGDFTTAPEISSLFGEMCGLYLAHMADLSGLWPTGHSRAWPGPWQSDGRYAACLVANHATTGQGTRAPCRNQPRASPTAKRPVSAS